MNYCLFLLIVSSTNIGYIVYIIKNKNNDRNHVLALELDIISKLIMGVYLTSFLQLYGVLFRNGKTSLFKYLWVLIFIMSHLSNAILSLHSDCRNSFDCPNWLDTIFMLLNPIIFMNKCQTAVYFFS